MNEVDSTERRFLGVIAVDSGTLLLADPAYVLPRRATNQPGVDYQAVIDSEGDAVSLAGTPTILLQAFGGDGTFPVFGDFEDGEIVRVTIELVEPEDDLG